MLAKRSVFCINICVFFHEEKSTFAFFRLLLFLFKSSIHPKSWNPDPYLQKILYKSKDYKVTELELIERDWPL